ncbi:CCA tRNA nucleotidyltransferase [Candidatus Parcubacteria bacterium]|nr:CCA tRNA nucleotidyltransferase [Candidatus Parcubacteria bacterium]
MEIPKYVKETIEKLEKAGYEAYIVGGCVRDLLMGVEPNDWDFTTNARPKAIQKIFKDSKYENVFGTVLLPIKNKDEKIETVLEITTYRSEHGYKDHRHPDEVKFEDKLDKDLERRDFTINAMAGKLKVESKKLKVKDLEIIDLFGGQKDIKKKIIRGVGEPMDRFKEDALRMVRAIRFSAQLGFEIEPKTERAIKKMAGSIKFVANERIKDELVKILSSDKAYEGFMKLYKTNLLNYIIPELLQGDGVAQNHHHVYSVLKHSFLSLKYCPNKEWQVRLAALFHDIGKPKTKEFKNGTATFYNHEYVGERMVRKIMKRLKFSASDTERAANLVRNHMFYYDTEEVTASSVRRLIKKVGKENLKDLIDIRIADRLGSGTPKAKPYKLRHLEYMFERVQNDPVSVKMLKINGDYMIEKLGFKPGIKMGAVLDVLLSEVIEDPELNNSSYLEKKAKELDKMNVEDLRARAKEKIKEKQIKDDSKMKKGYWVK